MKLFFIVAATRQTFDVTSEGCSACIPRGRSPRSCASGSPWPPAGILGCSICALQKARLVGPGGAGVKLLPAECH